MSKCKWCMDEFDPDFSNVSYCEDCRETCVHPCSEIYKCPCGECGDQCAVCGDAVDLKSPAAHDWTIREDGLDSCTRCHLVAGSIEIGGILND